jgi:hypothetical protein
MSLLTKGPLSVMARMAERAGSALPLILTP